MFDTIFELPRKRPGAITFVAVLVTIQGIFRLLVGFFLLLGALLGGWELTTSSVVVGFIAGVLVAIIGLLTLFFAWGLWTLKRWAYWATVILMVLDLLSSVFGLTQPITGIWTIWGAKIVRFEETFTRIPLYAQK